MASSDDGANHSLANASSTTACLALASAAKSLTHSNNTHHSFTSFQILLGLYSGIANILAIPSLSLSHLSVNGIVFFFSTPSEINVITIASSITATDLVANSALFVVVIFIIL
jgi:hypothetical protein